MGKNKNENSDKKKKRSIFSLFHKKNRYNWDIKKERARDKRLVDSFNFAIEGLISALKNEKHMKVHILAAIIIVILAIVINASKVEILIISLSVSFVIITELVNTAVEAIVDLVSPERHPLAKLAKDVAAGAVLVLRLMRFAWDICYFMINCWIFLMVRINCMLLLEEKVIFQF